MRISANATNGDPTGTTGGVRTLTLTIQRGDSVLLRGVSEVARDQNGRIPNGLAFLYSSWKPKKPIHVTVDNVPIVITATAINFHGRSNTLRVTYVPIDHASTRLR